MGIGCPPEPVRFFRIAARYRSISPPPTKSGVKLPEAIRIQWPIWRLVLPSAGRHGYRPPVATLKEIVTHWDIGNVYDANDILNAMDDTEYLAGLATPGVP